MNAARIKSMVSLFFFAAGIFVFIYMVHYVAVTQPRDARQERCNTDTIAVLTHWLEIRKQRDAAFDKRDEAGITAIDHQLTSGAVSPEDLKAWRDAITHDRQVRDTADAQSPPLPNC